MNIPALFVGALVLSIAWFRMDLLVNARSLLVILVICLLLFVGGFAVYTFGGYNYWAGALLCPLSTLALFHGLRWLFFKATGREPRDTFLDWKPELTADRVFNVIYFAFGTLILIFVPILARRLTLGY